MIVVPDQPNDQWLAEMFALRLVDGKPDYAPEMPAYGTERPASQRGFFALFPAFAASTIRSSNLGASGYSENAIVAQ